MPQKSFYKKILIDHYKNPRNKKVIADANFSSEKDNPSCGDVILISGIIEDERVRDVGFQGSGCVISLATASMLTEFCVGKTVEEVLSITKMAIIEMVGINLGPNRLKCALLPLEVIQKAIKSRGEL